MRNVLHVKVTNHNDFTIEDRYDGILYKFLKGKSLSVPFEAACHIFGVDFTPDESGKMNEGLKDGVFAHLQKRWGWNRTSQAKDAAKWFSKLEFSLTRHVLVEEAVENSEDEEELPEPHQIAAAKKGGVKHKEA